MDEKKFKPIRSRLILAHLRAVAYRMPVPSSEATTPCRRPWLRFSHANSGEIENPGGWLDPA